MRNATKMTLKTLTAIGLLSTATAQSSFAQITFKGKIQKQILSGERGGIALSVDAKNSVCNNGHLRFRNVATRKSFKGQFTSGKNIFKDGSSVRILTVPPGEYQITGGECRIYGGNVNTIQRLPNLNTIFGTIVVRSGEVAYPGTFVFPHPKKQRGRPVSVYGNPSGVWQDISRFNAPLAPRFAERPIGMYRNQIN